LPGLGRDRPEVSLCYEQPGECYLLSKICCCLVLILSSACCHQLPVESEGCMQDNGPETEGSASRPVHQEETGAKGRFEGFEPAIYSQFYRTCSCSSSDDSSRHWTVWSRLSRMQAICETSRAATHHQRAGCRLDPSLAMTACSPLSGLRPTTEMSCDA
jgi:hypothetical protein